MMAVPLFATITVILPNSLELIVVVVKENETTGKWHKRTRRRQEIIRIMRDDFQILSKVERN